MHSSYQVAIANHFLSHLGGGSVRNVRSAQTAHSDITISWDRPIYDAQKGYQFRVSSLGINKILRREVHSVTITIDTGMAGQAYDVEIWPFSLHYPPVIVTYTAIFIGKI